MTDTQWPLWIREEAARRDNAERGDGFWAPDDFLDPSPEQRAFMRLIAETMQEPVDPDIEEAREICAQVSGQMGFPETAETYREGRQDGGLAVVATLAALKSRPKP